MDINSESSQPQVPNEVQLVPLNYSKKIVFERTPGLEMVIAKENLGEKFGTKTTTPLTLVRQDLKIEIVNKVAKIEVFLYFYNETNRCVQGELIFPLPIGSSLQGFGVEIDGKMVDSVPVNKQLARVAFEEIHPEKGQVFITEKVDEYSNMYKTRIFPMNSKQTRVVKLVVFSELKEDKNNRLFWYDLCKTSSLKTINVDFNMKKGKVFVKGKQNDFQEIKDLKMINECKDLEGILIKLPKMENESIVIEKPPNDPQHYFCATVLLPTMKKKEKKEVKKIRVFFDVSSSRNSSEIDKEIELIQKIFRKFNKPELEVITFSYEIHERKTLKDEGSIKEYLSQLVFDGGSNIPLENFNKNIKDVDMIFLFTDGINTYGKEIDKRLEVLKFSVPIYTFSSSKKCSFLMLDYISRQSDGMFFDILTNPNAEKLIGVERANVKKIIYKESEFEDIFETRIDENGYVNFYGKCHKFGSVFEVDLGFTKINVKVGQTEVRDTSFIKTLWAQLKVSKLSIFSNKNKELIEKIGVEYSIVTPASSLIILEKLDQFKRYKICPPKQMKKLRKEYLNTIHEEEENEKKRETQKLETVVSWWNRRIEWHKRKFKLPKIVKKKKKKKTDSSPTTQVLTRDHHSDHSDPSDYDNNDSDSDSCSMDDDCLSCCSMDETLEPVEDNDRSRSRSRERVRQPRSLSLRARRINTPNDQNTTPQENDAPSSGEKVKVKKWNPETPYMKMIRKSKEPYKAYIKEKKEYGEAPSFYLDVASYFLDTLKNRKLGVRILSNIPELSLNNANLLRIIGYKLDQEEMIMEAVATFEKVLQLRPEEPQSYRDLALVLEKEGKFERAVFLLKKVILGKWYPRYNEIEITACNEMNHILLKIMDLKKRSQLIKKYNIDSRLIYKMDCDIRISMAWDTDMTDIDLHGSTASIPTKIRQLGDSFQEGYGPEVFMQRKVLKSGKYLITAKYFASHQQSLTGGTTILCSIFWNWMREDEESKLVTIRLSQNKEEIEVAQIEFNVTQETIKKPKTSKILPKVLNFLGLK